MSDPYLSADGRTLRNLNGITDRAELQAYEFEMTYGRLVALNARRLEGVYDLAHLCAFHRYIFAGIYDWAGELRTVNIAKDSSMFASARHLESAANSVFAQLANEAHLGHLDRRRFVERLAFYLVEINALHPFREGNGRAQRAFLSQLASNAGWHLDWARVSSSENLNASIAGHNGDEQPWRAILDRIVT